MRSFIWTILMFVLCANPLSTMLKAVHLCSLLCICFLVQCFLAADEYKDFFYFFFPLPPPLSAFEINCVSFFSHHTGPVDDI